MLLRPRYFDAGLRIKELGVKCSGKTPISFSGEKDSRELKQV
jgi:hypothetical protein